jgi:hypothetical protein
MIRTSARLATIGLLAGATTLVGGGTSYAGEGFPVTLTCDDGKTYQAVSNGNGDFTPARDTQSTRVFVPDSFGPFHGVVRDTEGNIVDEFTDPETGTKGSGKQKTNISCTFSFTEVSDGSDPELPEGYTFEGSGTVIGKVTGRR